MGDPLLKALSRGDLKGRLDLGCVAAHGLFTLDDKIGRYEVTPSDRAATAFLFKLIAHLQVSGTVPMIDVLAYAKWLDPDTSAIR